jgi:hypothetical protein
LFSVRRRRRIHREREEREAARPEKMQKPFWIDKKSQFFTVFTG